MKVTVAGHITIDTIISDRIQTTTLGGPPSYAGLTATNLGAEVTLFTKYGEDLPEEYLLWLIRNQLKIGREARSTTHLTTRFRIVQKPEGRELYLEARCEDLETLESRPEGDAVIISPVAGEVSLTLLSEMRKGFGTVYLDPQGFIRRFHPDGRCFLTLIDRRLLKHSDIVKMDKEEAYMITGSRNPLGALENVVKEGIRVAIYTEEREGVLLSNGEDVFRIPVVGETKVLDTTGAGDVFAGAYVTAYLQGEDPVWAGCVAVAASSVGLDRVGLSKILGIEAVAKAAEEISEKIERVGGA